MSHSTTYSVRVWDLPTRLFHFFLIISVVGCLITVKLGGLWMDWHVRFGLVTAGLIVFRLVWGWIGGYYSRFKQFPPNPKRSWDYLTRKITTAPGHNPLGAWSVYIMLLVLAFQAFSGLFANDDIFTAGPLAFLSASWSKTLTGLHKSNEWIILTVIAVHILAILAYRIFAGQKLSSGMVHGRQTHTAASRPAESVDNWKTRMLAIFIALLIACLLLWINSLAPSGSMDDFM